MATDRQTIMETNRSLRTIKNELENLLEKGVIDDETYENIHNILPAEAPLRGGRAPAPAAPSNNAAPPTNAMSNLNLESQRSTSSPAPPSYQSSTNGAAPPPGPPPAPTKPVIAHARALYRYNGADSRDLSFERDDKVQVHEYMNADWWMGRNTRTGAEGIFPKTYVAVESTESQPRAQPGYGPPTGQPGYGQHGYNPQPATQQLWPPPGQQQQQQYPPPGPPPQQQQNQENHDQNNQQEGEEKKDGAGKAKEYGEKFGKKLGNAAIFGAGATLGSNLVNSIF
ncbi:SH3 domain-containing protein [Plectosphaerella plurivora]|uniref:SH3 domain-containing protein n=1 Tax=Plectosphaerella plurivora TaxID=936078 RepID=A0A9P8VN69_9PEZI|nr:SH3 domain-containing protein [Plectosphaerella plurivora]